MMRLLAILSLLVVSVTATANATAATCGFITVPSGFLPNPTDPGWCGYFWFRDIAMAEVWVFSAVWLIYAWVSLYCFGEPQSKRALFLKSVFMCVPVPLIDFLMFIIMGGLAFIAVEIVGVLFILLQIVVESECTCCFGGGGYQPLNVKQIITPGSVADSGAGSRFDSIRPRIQFAPPKYKPISEA